MPICDGSKRFGSELVLVGVSSNVRLTLQLEEDRE
jgi:hypothetical protein